MQTISIIIRYLAIAFCLDYASLHVRAQIPPVSPIDQCQGEADVVLMIDDSGSIGYRSFELVVAYVGNLIRTLTIDEGRVSVALVLYSHAVDFSTHLNTLTTRDAVRNALFGLTYKGGGVTDIGVALAFVNNEIFTPANGDRAGVQNIVVLFSDGGTNTKASTAAQAIITKTAKSALILAVSVTSHADIYELQSLASYSYLNNLLTEEIGFTNATEHLTGAICNNIKACQPDTCSNGGTCANTPTLYECTCPAPYGGVVCDYSCRDPANVVFLVDSASFLGVANFWSVISTVQLSALGLPIASVSHVGLMTFSDTPHVYFRLNDYRTALEVLDVMSLMYLEGTRSDIAAALTTLTNDIFGSNGIASSLPKRAVLIIDAKSVNQASTLAAATLARNAGIELLVVGVGELVSIPDLQNIASYPVQRNIFLYQNYSSLNFAVAPIRNSICNQVNECLSNPCQNGGTCTDVMNGFTCACNNALFSGSLCQRSCPGNINILFVLDTSFKIRENVWPSAISFLVGVLQDLQIGGTNSGAQIALMTFSDSPRMVFGFGTYSNALDIINRVRQLQWTGGHTNIAAALQAARQQVFANLAGASNFLVLFSNGGSDLDKADTVPEAVATRLAGINILGIAIGDFVDVDELPKIAGYDPNFSKLLIGSLYSQLGSLSTTTLSTLCPDAGSYCGMNNCLNGGTCTNLWEDFVCACPVGFTGKNCERRCTLTADIVILLDMSTSDSLTYFSEILFLQTVVMGLDFHNGNTRVALINFSTNATIQFYLNKLTTMYQVLQSLTFTTILGHTNTQAALRMAREMVLTPGNGERQGIQDRVIILTDGGSNILANNTQYEAQLLKNETVIIDVIGIGPQVPSGLGELYGLASEPTSQHLQIIPYDTMDVTSVTAAAETLLNSLCSGGGASK